MEKKSVKISSSKKLVVRKKPPSATIKSGNSSVTANSSTNKQPVTTNSSSVTTNVKSASNGAVTTLLIFAIFLISFPFLISCFLSSGVSSLFSSAAGSSQGLTTFCEDFWLGVSNTLGFECGEVYEDIINFFEDIDETIDKWENIVQDSLSNWNGKFQKWGGKIDNWTDNVEKWGKKFDKWF